MGMGKSSKTSSRKKPAHLAGKKKKSGFRRVFWTVTLLVLLVIFGGGFGYVAAVWNSLPNVDNVNPVASTEIYDSQGKLITTIHAEQNRILIENLDDAPKYLQEAFIATEDSRFYSHHGIDPIGIMRAIWVNIRHDGVAEGGSTITQQLARNAFLTQDRTLKRKIQEALLAIKIERTHSKQEIFRMYMNEIYFGRGAYGVQAAAQLYFGKPVQSLNLAQCAMLAGLPQSPNYYSPLNNMKAAKERQSVVLHQMFKYGYITEAQMEQAEAADVELHKQNDEGSVNGVPRYFINYIISQSDKYIPAGSIYKGGYKIYTTLNMKDQRAAERAMSQLPNYYKDQNGLEQPQAAIVALDPHTGAVLAMVGGRGTDDFNRAVMAERQPGSSFKPFVYLAAMQTGRWNPGSTIEDSPVKYGDYAPQNYSRNFSGKVTLRYALTHSLNVPAVKLANDVGMKNVLKLAKTMGITTIDMDRDNALSSALGGLTNGVTPLDMATAYAVLANGGKKIEPYAIREIKDREGNTIYEAETKSEQIVDPKDVYAVTSMLSSAIREGTGGNAYFGVPSAGKTGTTDDSKDAWFVGYTPDMVCAVWIGDDYGSQTLHGMTGGTTPASMWRTYMSAATASGGHPAFTVPRGAEGMDSLGREAPKKDDKDKDKDKDKKDGDTDSDKKDNGKGDGKGDTKATAKPASAAPAKPAAKPNGAGGGEVPLTMEKR